MDRVTDLNFLINFTKNNPDSIRRFVEIFLRTAPLNLERMENALANKDWITMKSAAHILKPNCNYLGIQSLIPVIDAIEKIITEENNFEALPALVKEAGSILTRAIDELSAELTD